MVAQFESYLEATRRPQARAEVKRAMSGFEQLAEAMLTSVGAVRPAEGARMFVALLDGFALHRLAWPGRSGERQLLREAILSLLAAQIPNSERTADP